MRRITLFALVLAATLAWAPTASATSAFTNCSVAGTVKTPTTAEVSTDSAGGGKK